MSTYDPMCRERCAYGTCSDPGRYHGPYGCGGCCGCRGGCQVAYEATLPLVEPAEQGTASPPVTRCICSGDRTGEDIDERPDCSVHAGAAPSALSSEAPY